jgi:ketosteroid isomerase-like protein
MFRKVLFQEITKAFESGDFGPLLDHLDDNVIWKSASRVAGNRRPGGDYYGRMGVIEATAQICMAITFHRFELLEVIQDDQVLWGLFNTVVSSSNGVSEPLQYETALRIRFKEGRIAEIQSFFDTAQLTNYLSRS